MALSESEKATWDLIVELEDKSIYSHVERASRDMRLLQFVELGSYNAIDENHELLEQVRHEYMLDPEELEVAIEIVEQGVEDGS